MVKKLYWGHLAPHNRLFVLPLPWAHTEVIHSHLLTFTEVEKDQGGLHTSQTATSGMETGVTKGEEMGA